MTLYTEEQLAYINFFDKIDTVLIACAGSGKTQCIAVRILNLIKNNIFASNEIMMLTFSRNTQQDFVRRVNKIDSDKLIDINNIRTIDSFAKQIIDKDNNVDVNLLSYRFKKYLENTDADILKTNNDLNKIKIIFTDEAQDLNLIQYSIIQNLNKKLGIIINMIGDPNQNIYQFRNSSDKYLMNFPGKRFYLTYNFRSSLPLINFSSYIRPYQETQINMGNNELKDINYLPTFMFTKDDYDMEHALKITINQITEENINLKDVAILAPTRGGMYGTGSNGLCFITNILTKLNIQFKQWYEEADDVNNSITYNPEDNHINVLTYMGSKGLEWKIVIVIDAEICLINKNIFNEEKHNYDRYLLYVACSRATHNMMIFSKFREIKKDNMYKKELKINPWFKLIPKHYYNYDGIIELEDINFPEVILRNKLEIDKSVTKLLNQLTEEELDYICNMFDFENINKEVISIYKIKHTDENFISPIFLGRYIEAIFVTFYRLYHNKDKYRYPEIEKIIYAKKIIRNKYIKKILIDWFNSNRTLTWEEYYKIKNTISKDLIEQIDKFFDKKYEIREHMIINDGFYDDYIIKNKDKFKENYDLYLKSSSQKELKIALFNIILIEYALETQHYFHIKNDGFKFKDVLIKFKDLINKVITYTKKIDINFINNIRVTFEDIEGEIDLLTDDNIIYEIKCVKELNIKHLLQVLTYNIMLNNYKENEKHNIKLNFYNLYKGQKVIYTVKTNKINELIKILQNKIINQIKIN